MDLSGKIAIVTGGGRGIGRAISTALAEAGAQVIVNYNQNAEAAQEVAEAIGGQCVQADVTTVEGCQSLIAAAEALGSLDIVVNNAGITRDGLLPRMRDEDWTAVLDTNLGGTFRMCRAASMVMMGQRRGSIINITSVSGVRGNAGQTNYSASKAAIAGMTRSLAKELARRNIRVNCLAPGFVETDMVKAMDPRVIDAAKKAIPMRRLARPEEIAAVVCFLASDLSSYVTGQEWIVDGGMSA
ncbi:MAG: 3-oxoacyl-[acyl-carrier protein] reductase [Myxococcota bacterium]|jgi:3-oxoacyl-[acyl-carrier protein] reductase